MIACNQLTKQYGNLCVIDSFSLLLPDNGFFLLLGESGSGKTTFLNILAGFISFDEGSISYGESRYTDQVHIPEPLPFEYITQDTFFVDYLTVEDNLRLLGTAKEQYSPLLEQFGLSEKATVFPPVLSGGERARLAVIRALLKGKKILFLDEPTAALDEINKAQVFSFLSSLKKKVLILCATHDTDAILYADAILHFSKTDPKPYLEEKNKVSEAESIHAIPEGKMSKAGPDPMPFLKPWFTSNKREKSSKVLYLLFLLLSLLLLFLADTPSHKLKASCEDFYHINALQLRLRGGTTLSDLDFDKSLIREIVVDYTDSCPNVITSVESYLINNQVFLLPEKAENCMLSSRILFGSYYTAEKQIILSYEMAQRLSSRDPSRMIGKTISQNFYGLGLVDLEIVGVFDKLTTAEWLYLNGCGAQISLQQAQISDRSTRFFVNAALLASLVENPDFFRDEEQRSYYLYFSSYAALDRFVKRYESVFREKNAYLVNMGIRVETQFRIESFSQILLPFALLIAAFTVIFYAELYKTEFVHNNSFISVFEYAGYSKKLVLKKLMNLCLLEFMKIQGLAFLLALSLAWIINSLNHRFFWVEFELCSFHPVLVPFFLISLVLFAALSITKRFQKVRVRSWYENLLANRDVL